ncbi:enoyl-CoA hydratase [Pseudohyphozyma bogoriensis]|nr:enoyl-CoA hydratase [Pseudohyphozyma bogoriensis]
MGRRSYSTRSVVATQDGKPIFTLTASFCLPEPKQPSVARPVPLFERNGKKFKIPDPEECLLAEDQLALVLQRDLPVKVKEYIERVQTERQEGALEMRNCDRAELGAIISTSRDSQRQPHQAHWFRTRAQVRKDPAFQKTQEGVIRAIVRLARERQLNALTPVMQEELSSTFDCFAPTQEVKLSNPNGFGGVSARAFKKPLIVALNGHCLGGGAEMAMNGDMIIGFDGIVFGFPEVKRGVTARLGGISALYRASPTLVPYLLSGITIPQPLLSTHIFSSTVPTAADVFPEALKWAHALLQASPDAVMVTKEQLQLAKSGLGDREIVVQSAAGAVQRSLYEGENFEEGLRAFREKRDPKCSL